MTEAATSSRLASLRRLLPLLVFIVAFLIRIPGAGWGLKNDLHNQSYHPDEAVIWAYSQQIEPTKGQFTPGFYNYGTLYLTGLRVVSDMTAAYTGGPDPKSADSTWAFVSRVHFAARILSVLAGAGTVVAIFLMLRRRIADIGAIMGALLVAVAPGHVMHSRFQTTDVLATLFLALSALFAIRVLDETSPKRLLRFAVLSGFFAGLSAGTKYTGILALVTLAICLAWRMKSAATDEGAIVPKGTLLKGGLLGVLTSIAIFVVVTPGAVLDSAAFMRDVKFEMLHTSTGHGFEFAGTGSGFIYHLTNLFLGVGGILTVLGLIGLMSGILKREPMLMATGAFFLLYFALIGRAEVTFLRYTFPLLIGLAAGFGFLVSEAHQKGGAKRLVVVLGFFGLAGIDSRALVGSVNDTVAMVGEDSRDTAVRSMRSNGTTSIGLARDPWFWSVPVFPDSTAMRGMSLSARLQAAQTSSQPPLVLSVHATPEGKPAVDDFDLKLVTELKPERIAMTALEFDAMERLVGRKDIPADAQSAASHYRDFMAAMAKEYRLEKQYGTASRGVHDMMYVDPVVLVWQRNPTP